MKIWMQGALAVAVAAAQCGAAAQKQTDVALSGYATFTSSSSGNGTQQTPQNSVGGLFELRRIVNPLVGFELSYSLNPANQSYSPKTGACGYVCGTSPLKIDGKANEVAVNWVLSVSKGNIRPFALGGVGLMITVPGSSTYSVTTFGRPVFVYGAGADLGLTKRLGVRLQVRGNMTKAPGLSTVYPATTAYTQIYEPMGGVYYRF